MNEKNNIQEKTTTKTIEQTTRYAFLYIEAAHINEKVIYYH